MSNKFWVLHEHERRVHNQGDQLNQGVHVEISAAGQYKKVKERTRTGTLLSGIAIPFLHMIVRQSPALATKSLSCTRRAVVAVHPGCQSVPPPFLNFRSTSNSWRKLESVSINALINASRGLQTQSTGWNQYFIKIVPFATKALIILD